MLNKWFKTFYCFITVNFSCINSKCLENQLKIEKSYENGFSCIYIYIYIYIYSK